MIEDGLVLPNIPLVTSPSIVIPGLLDCGDFMIDLGGIASPWETYGVTDLPP